MSSTSSLPNNNKKKKRNDRIKSTTSFVKNEKQLITDKKDDHAKKVLVVIADSNSSSSSSSSSTIINGNNQRSRVSSSPVCQPHFGKQGRKRIKRVYFAHMRKAGGTTVKHYLKRVTKKHKLKWNSAEGTHFEYPGTRNDTLYVTNLRDPVSRMISHYKYSGRWACEQLVDNRTKFQPTKENAQSLQDFLIRYEKGYPPSEWRKECYECTTNCYINWLNLKPNRTWCFPKDDSSIMETRGLQSALTALYGYNIIIDIDRLAKDPRYVSKLEHFFGEEGLLGLHPRPWCDKQSKEANKRFPMEKINNATLEDLYHRNSADYQLYNEIIHCDNYGGIQFPSESLTDFLK